MIHLEFFATVGIGGLNSSKHRTIQKKIATIKCPFEFDRYYGYCSEYDQDQRKFLKAMFGEEFDEFSRNFKSFIFKKIEFQIV